MRAMRLGSHAVVKMLIRGTLFVLVATVLPPVCPAGAAADECFCLTDDQDAVWFDCVQQQRPLQPYPLFFCRKPGTNERERVPNGHQLTRVKAGELPCTPCRLSAVHARDTIRGEEGAETRKGDETQGTTSPDMPPVQP